MRNLIEAVAREISLGEGGAVPRRVTAKRIVELIELGLEIPAPLHIRPADEVDALDL